MTMDEQKQNTIVRENKTPIHIRREMIKYQIWPSDRPHKSVALNLYISTEKIQVGTWQLTPGAISEAADWHDWDEGYYILDGLLTLHNPKTGQFVQAAKNDGMYIPAHAYHKGYNFSQNIMRALYVQTPSMSSGKNPDIDFNSGNMCIYKGNSQLLNPDQTTKNNWIDLPFTTDRIGKYPVSGPMARQEPISFYHITEDRKLINIHGGDHPMLIKFFISNDVLHLGEFILPSGGQGPRASEPDVHHGDCVLYIDKGPVIVYLPDTAEVFNVETEELLYLPMGTKYQLINYTDSTVKIIFSVSPEM
jgi:mannose-6-phosphate isomerase-like protein (cupin superfamily)